MASSTYTSHHVKLPHLNSMAAMASCNVSCSHGLRPSLAACPRGQIALRSGSPASARGTSIRVVPRPGLSRVNRRGQSGVRVTAQVSKSQTFKGQVIPEPDFRIAGVLLGTAGLLVLADQKLLAAPIGLLGGLLLLQTTRVRFLLDEDSLEVVIGEEAAKSGENVFVGGENRWKYSTFTNWEFWWPGFPVLVYFKETQTKPEGQVHFFPVIADGKKLYDTMVERCGSTQNSGPPS